MTGRESIGKNTPPPHEKKLLFDKTTDLLNSDYTRVIDIAEDDDHVLKRALFLEKETDPQGDLRRLGYTVVSLKRSEAYTKRGKTRPEVTTLKAMRSFGEEFVWCDFVEFGETYEITQHMEPEGLKIPDDLSGIPSITVLESLDIRSILQGLHKEV